MNCDCNLKDCIDTNTLIIFVFIALLIIIAYLWFTWKEG